MTILPDRFYIRREDAEDVAGAIVAAIHTIGRSMWVYMIPSGRLGIEMVVLPTMLNRNTQWLVGHYDEHASTAQIRDDIRACKREPL